MILKHKKYINLKKNLIFFKNTFKTQCEIHYNNTLISKTKIQPPAICPDPLS
jgi:hypothetical protein